MPEYIYIDENRHKQSLTVRMMYSTAVICTTCGDIMWRKPHPVGVSWGGLRPSQGEIHPSISNLIDDAPRRREEYEHE